MIYLKLCVLVIGCMSVCSSCKTKDMPPTIPVSEAPRPIVAVPSPPPIVPVKEADPMVSLFFDRVEAKTIEHITLYFILHVANPRSVATDTEIQDWYVQINEQRSEEGVSLVLDSDDTRVEPLHSAQFPIRLDINLGEFPSKIKYRVICSWGRLSARC
jgi:hypothetical protein